MANKKISEFPSVTTLSNSDIFLINSLGTTSSVSLAVLSGNITNSPLIQNSIQKPLAATNGQVLTYNGSTWVASAVPTELPSGTNEQVLTHNGTAWVAGDPVASEPYSAKAFGSIRYENGNTSGNNESNGTGSQATEVAASSFYNVVSVTWMERGIYRVILTNTMPNINYSVVAQNAPANGFTFSSNGDENFMDYSSPDYYHNGNENSLFIFNKTISSFDVVSWSQESNSKENINSFDFVVFSV